MASRIRNRAAQRGSLRGTKSAAITVLLLASLAAYTLGAVFAGFSSACRPVRRSDYHISGRVAVGAGEVVETKVLNSTDNVPSATVPESRGWAEGRFPGVKPSLIPDVPVEGLGFVDEQALRQIHTFPIPEEDLVQLAKAFLAVLFDDVKQAKQRLAPNFRFVAPVVPAFGDGLSGDALIDALVQFDIKQAVPDLDPQHYDFRTDPYEPNRVWFTARGRGTNTGLVFGALPATGKSYESPPQTQSLTFNKVGEITKMTIGYVMDKEVGNTGGLGGIFGILYGIGYGLPVPEAQPWRPSLVYRLLFMTGELLRSFRHLAR